MNRSGGCSKSQHEQLVEAIKDGRKLDAEAALQVIDGSPYTDEQAVARKVIDAVLSEEQLPQRLSSGAEVRIGDWDQARKRMSRPAPRLRLGSYVAIIRIEGTIIDGRSGRPPVAPPIEIPVVGDPRAGDLTVVQVARQVAADRRAAAAVVYVDSRGGSATASEAMRQALAVVAARKPMVIAMGSVAGSGGYWVATPGRWIVARPGTLTGSIGVLSGKLVTGGLWAKLLVNRETVAVRAGTRSWQRREAVHEGRAADRARARSTGSMRTVSSTWSPRARGMTRDEVAPDRGGKVWTGAQALERKLVDELGGLDAALRKARSLAGLPATTPAFEVHGPRRPSRRRPSRRAAGLGG